MIHCIAKVDDTTTQDDVPTVDTEVIGTYNVDASALQADATNVIVYMSPGPPSKSPPP